jgi:DNA uptake protein ComE-like DNA-binding protein
VTFLLKGKINMADMTTLTTDPFFALTGQVNGVREKVSDSIFENYKLQVAQTNDINNRAMQVALHDASELASIKQEIANGTLQTMLAAARTDAAIGATSSALQRLTMEQGEATRRLIVDLNTQNLNTALINTNTALNAQGVQYAGLGLAYGGAVAAYQSANTNSALSALNSAIASQSSNVIGAGAVGGTQTATPTTVV